MERVSHFGAVYGDLRGPGEDAGRILSRFRARTAAIRSLVTSQSQGSNLNDREIASFARGPGQARDPAAGRVAGGGARRQRAGDPAARRRAAARAARRADRRPRAGLDRGRRGRQHGPFGTQRRSRRRYGGRRRHLRVHRRAQGGGAERGRAAALGAGLAGPGGRQAGRALAVLPARLRTWPASRSWCARWSAAPSRCWPSGPTPRPWPASLRLRARLAGPDPAAAAARLRGG